MEFAASFVSASGDTVQLRNPNGLLITLPVEQLPGDDACLFGELDEFGGHCGRADDYHYHLAPVHLEKQVGKGIRLPMPSMDIRFTVTRSRTERRWASSIG